MIECEDYEDFVRQAREEDDDDDDAGYLEPILPPQAGGAALVEHQTDIINALPN